MGYLPWEWEYQFDWEFVRYGRRYSSWRQWPVEGTYQINAYWTKSSRAILIDSFGRHTPVQDLKLGISPMMVGSLSREAINVSMSVIMVGRNMNLHVNN